MGRFITVVLILAVGVGALGFYLNWWRFDQTSHGGETGLTLTVDKNKIKSDTGKAAGQVRNAGRDAKQQLEQLSSREAVRGKVLSIDADKRMLTVIRDKAESIMLHTVDATTVKRNGETISLREVQPDQPVMVEYTTEEGKHIARSITVETK